MAETETAQVAARESVRDRGLKRGIGPFGLAAAIVNVVVGAGIFSLPAGMARAAGPYALAAYFVCAVAMAAVVLCCAEAGSRVPTSGGLYGFVEAAFGPLAGFVAGVLLWVSCVLACGGIAAALAGALAKLSPTLSSPAVRDAVILGAIGVMMAVNLAGVRNAARFVSVMTAVKLLPLLLFLAVGFFFVEPARLASGAPPSAAGIGRAVILSLFAFQGMETALGANGEVRKPARTLPLALMAAMAFVAALYVAIQLVCQGILGADLAASAAPLADAIARVDPRLGLVILIGTAVSMFGWIGSDLLGAPRLLFAFARDGFLPAALGRLSPKTHVPTLAILVHGALAMALGVTGTFEQLAAESVLFACLLYIGACAAAWRLSRQRVALVGPPLRLPVLAFWSVVGVLSMAAVIVLARPIEIAGLAAAVLASAVLYLLVTRFRRPR